MRFDVFGAGMICMAFAAVWPATGAENPAAGEGNYGETLSRVYFAHQRLLALREACDQAFPVQAKANEKAYAAWRARHKALLAELDARVAMMIRGSSKDEREYMRNIGKYEGAIMEERNDYRDRFAAQPREEVERLCRDFPNYLTGSGSDFHREYADELRELRKRKLSQ